MTAAAASLSDVLLSRLGHPALDSARVVAAAGALEEAGLVASSSLLLESSSSAGFIFRAPVGEFDLMNCLRSPLRLSFRRYQLSYDCPVRSGSHLLASCEDLWPLVYVPVSALLFGGGSLSYDDSSSDCLVTLLGSFDIRPCGL